MAHYEEAFNRLDHCLKQRMNAFHTPALVMALTDQEKLVRLSALGLADLSMGTPAETGHLFAIGSIGKSFTGLAVLQACERRLLDLRAPVKAYLPWFEIRSRYEPITLHHLLTHSAGLPRGTDFTPDPVSEVYGLRELEAGFAPGTHFAYSDVGYKILGLVLEAVNGKPYAEVIREGILEPMEMCNTYAETTHTIRPRMAKGYRDLYDDRPTSITHPLEPADWVETNSGDGCIVSTAEDMAKFARMLLNGGKGPRGPLLSPSNFSNMLAPQIDDEGETYSYGLYLFEDDGYRVAGHGGDVPGYECYMWLDLDNGLGAVVLMTQPYTPRASFLALEYFRAAHLGMPLPETPPMPNFSHIRVPGDYAGEYTSETCTLRLVAENHYLYLMCQDQRVTLEERSYDCFYANHPEWERYLLRFERAKDGRVAAVSHGPNWLYNQNYEGPTRFASPAAWQAFTGHYRAHNPWSSNFRVFTRKGQLILSWPTGDEEVLSPLTADADCAQFRIGEEEYIPERLVFDQVVNGQALRAVRSGCAYYRFFTP